MKKSRGVKAIKEIARKRGIRVAEARREMELAIDAAMLNPDPASQEFWDKYMQSGNKLTPEDFIVYIAKKIESDKRSEKTTSGHEST